MSLLAPLEPQPGRDAGTRRAVGRSANIKYCQDLPSASPTRRSLKEMDKGVLHSTELSISSPVSPPSDSAKSAKVTRLPRETMCNHRSSKLVRNSSISRWRAKFRKNALSPEGSAGTDTEQLLDEVEDASRPSLEVIVGPEVMRAPAVSSENGRVLGRRSQASSSCSSNSSSRSSSKNSSYSNNANNRKNETAHGWRHINNSSSSCSSSISKTSSCSYGINNRNSESMRSWQSNNSLNDAKSHNNKNNNSNNANGSPAARDARGWVTHLRPGSAAGEGWAGGVPPPRCLTPHRVQLGGALIPWVGTIQPQGGESPYYLPMGGGHAVTSGPKGLPYQVNRGDVSPPCYERPFPPVVSREAAVAAEAAGTGSWPLSSRTHAVRDLRDVRANPSRPSARRDDCSASLMGDLPGRATSPSAGGDCSHFGTFPRRRPAQKGESRGNGLRHDLS